MGSEHSVLIIQLLSMMVGLCLWGLSIWFFLVAVGSLWKYCKPTKNMPFQMTFFSFVFPNTALVSWIPLYIFRPGGYRAVFSRTDTSLLVAFLQVTATEQLGKAFDSVPLKTVGSVFAGCVVIVWFLVFGFMLRALWNRTLLWPKDGDED